MESNFLGLSLLLLFYSSGNAGIDLEDVEILAELPLETLLVRKVAPLVGNDSLLIDVPQALSLVEDGPKKNHWKPRRKTFHDYDHDDEKYMKHKKKKKDKIHDVLNTSITTLSYLAFGGYLLCMVVTTLREKRRRFAMPAFSYAGALNAQPSPQLTHVMQHYLTQRPVRIRFPAATVVNHGRKKRGIRIKEPKRESRNPEYSLFVFN